MTGDELRAWRRVHRLSQQQVADLLDISVRTIKRWEVGDQVPPAYLPLALERLHQLLRRTPAPPPIPEEPLVN